MADPNAREKLLQDYREVFGTAPGKRVLADLLRRCGWGKSAMGTDAHGTAYQCGRQDVGNEVQALLNEKGTSHE